jgi:hypothetical protein
LLAAGIVLVGLLATGLALAGVLPARQVPGAARATQPTKVPQAKGVGFCRMRRRLPWLVALPVMAAGSLAAHALSYLAVSARAAENGGEMSERTSSGDTSLC